MYCFYNAASMVTKPDIHDVDRTLAAFAQNMNLDVKL